MLDACNRSVLSENYSLEYWEKMFSKRHSCFILCPAHTNRVLGYIMSDSDKPDNFHVVSFGILKKYRGQGWGLKLLQCFLDDVKHRCTNITLNVRKNNKRALKIYRRFGFGFYKKQKNYYGKDQHGLLLMLNLE